MVSWRILFAKDGNDETKDKIEKMETESSTNDNDHALSSVGTKPGRACNITCAQKKEDS